MLNYMNKIERIFIKMKLNIEEKEIKTDKKIIGVQISYELYLKLKTMADERFISVSDLVRSYIFKCTREDNEQKQC